jgi:hypothetical protein
LGAVTVAVLAACAGLALAQYRVNNQIYGNTGPSISYAGGHSSYGQATGSSVAMRSEVQNAAFRAGAMPSEVRMNYAQLGPMMQGGPIAYVPAAGPRYTVGSVGTVGNYLGAGAPGGAPSSFPMSPTTGSVRYSGSSSMNSAALFPSVSTSAAKLSGSSISTPAATATIPTNQLFSTPSLGSVRYGP